MHVCAPALCCIKMITVLCAALLVGFVIVAVEGIGDITATEEASMLATTGSAHSRRIQGGILADGAALTPLCCLGLKFWVLALVLKLF